MKCPRCGAELQAGSKFCQECGGKIQEFQKTTIKESDSTSNESEAADYEFDDTQVRPRYPTNTPVDNLFRAASGPSRKLEKYIKEHLYLIVVGMLIIVLLSNGWNAIQSKHDKVMKNTAGVQKTEEIEDAPTEKVTEKIIMLTVPDVVGMPAQEALETLKATGFTNIYWDHNNDSTVGQWIVTEQDIEAGTSVEANCQISLISAKKCSFYLDLHSEQNLFLSTYDIVVILDGTEIGTIPNGKILTHMADVLSGNHVLSFQKYDDSNVSCSKSITVSDDMTFRCDLAHSGDSIEIRNETTESGTVGSSLEVVDVTGMVCSDAIATLEEIGFANIREEPFGSIWNRENWIVTAQSIDAGTKADKNDFIQLDCISLDDHFSSLLVGKNIAEVESLAESDGFSVRYADVHSSDMSDIVAEMTQETKQLWTVTKARQYYGSKMTALITIDSPEAVASSAAVEETGQESSQPTDAPTSEPTQEPTKAPEKPVSYSTNDLKTAKKGNSGVFSYRSNGKTYYCYYIIDFDEGYVYCFRDGETTCERVKIASGDLNSVLVITYHEGGDTRSYGLHFKWKNQPDYLILQDEDGFETDFYTTDLNDALALKARKTIRDY